MTALLISSFLAGVLTILAPCVLPVLPIVLAGSVTEKQSWYPYLVTLSLAVSIVLFTILLKASTLFIDIPPSFWKYLSGGILLVLGLIYIFPHAWAWIGGRLGLGRSNVSLDRAQDIGSPVVRAIATGAALGPVFSTCSPTYSLLLATVFPVSFFAGIGYTLVYALGLSLMLTIIAIGGRSIVARFRGIADEKGWFKRILGVIFVLIGLAIITGLDKKVESKALDIWNPSSLEEGLLDTLIPRKESMQIDTLVTPTVSIVSEVPVNLVESSVTSPEVSETPPPISLPTPSPEQATIEEKKIIPPIATPKTQEVISQNTPTPVIVSPKTVIKSTLRVPEFSLSNPHKAPELRGLGKWINSSPLTLAGLQGKVTIVEFWTFGCSNCQATIPRIQALYEKYRSQGLTIIGVHAPEFSYEQKYENVVAAVKKWGITYPVVLDNEFSTWNAYDNQYWPAMYIIDKSGKVRHTHFGEGQYAETDEIVRYLLSE